MLLGIGRHVDPVQGGAEAGAAPEDGGEQEAEGGAGEEGRGLPGRSQPQQDQEAEAERPGQAGHPGQGPGIKAGKIQASYIDKFFPFR